MGNFAREADPNGDRFVWMADEVAEIMGARGDALYQTHFDTCSAIEHPDFEAPF